MKLVFLFARILWLRYRMNSLNAEISRGEAKIDYWDRQHEFLQRRIAALELAERN